MVFFAVNIKIKCIGFGYLVLYFKGFCRLSITIHVSDFSWNIFRVGDNLGHHGLSCFGVAHNPWSGQEGGCRKVVAVEGIHYDFVRFNVLGAWQSLLNAFRGNICVDTLCFYFLDQFAKIKGYVLCFFIIIV